MTIPTHGETYAKLMENLRQCEELAAMKAHLHNADGGANDPILASAWLQISELFKRVQHNITNLAQGRLQ